MPKIHCKHCKKSFSHDKGKFPKAYFKHLSSAHPKAAKTKHKPRGSSRNATSSDRPPIGKRLSVQQLYALLAMVKALIAMQEGHHRSKRKGKRKK